MSVLRCIIARSQPLLGITQPLLSMRQPMAAMCRSFAKKHNPPPMCSAKKKKGNSAKCGSKIKKECLPHDHKCKKENASKNGADEFQFHHLIKLPEYCCEDPCQDMDFPRFDECYYKESDKRTRKYQITWVECPKIKIKPKKICCFGKAKHPPIVRRSPKNKPDTCKQVKCPEGGDCPRFQLPNCRKARNPPLCIQKKEKEDCKKVNCPYPAFSECQKARIRKKPRTECECLSEVPLCEVYAEMRRRSGTKGGVGQCGGGGS